MNLANKSDSDSHSEFPQLGCCVKCKWKPYNTCKLQTIHNNQQTGIEQSCYKKVSEANKPVSCPSLDFDIALSI